MDLVLFEDAMQHICRVAFATNDFSMAISDKPPYGVPEDQCAASWSGRKWEAISIPPCCLHLLHGGLPGDNQYHYNLLRSPYGKGTVYQT